MLHSILQQLLIGLTNGMVFALIALGYTMVYGILELVNFAHGDLFMLAGFFALTLMGLLDVQHLDGSIQILALVVIVLASACFGAGVNWGLDRVVFRQLRNAPKLAPLVSAIGVSFILQNIGLFWGGLPMAIFNGGRSAAAPKTFPDIISNTNLLGDNAWLRLTAKDLLVMGSSLSIMFVLVAFVRFTRWGRAMRACAQDPVAARLMGIDVDRIVSLTFSMGGALAGVAAVIYGLYINTLNYQIGYQNGLYAFTAAVLGGIGNIFGAVLGGLTIGVVRALSDQFIGTQWQPAVLFGLLITLLIFRPSGLLGSSMKEKV